MSGKRDDLNDIQKEALKSLKESLIANNTLFGGDNESSSSSSIRIWGVELTKNSLDEKKEEIVLLKFLRARDFKVDASEKMFIDCIRWRKEFNLNELMEETFPSQYDESLGYIHKTDKEGRPLVINVYGGLDNDAVFGNLDQFLRWRVQLMEKGIALLDFNNNIEDMVQIHDYRGVKGSSMDDKSKAASKATIRIMSDNYPEFMARKCFVNVPWYFAGVFAIFRPLLSDRTLSKFVVCSSSDMSPLLEFIEKDVLPEEYGGTNRSSPSKRVLPSDRDDDDAATEVVIDARKRHVASLVVSDKDIVVNWEYRTIENNIGFSIEFAATAEAEREVIHEYSRVDSHLKAQTGSWTATGKGTCYFIWDNEFSIMSKKTVQFRTAALQN